MSRLATFLLLGLLLSMACNPTKRLLREHPPRQYLPAAVQELYFGMPLSEFQLQRQAAREGGGSMSFRQVWVEKPQDPALESIAYYFDSEGDTPLYEIIINYRDVAVRDAWIAEHLGGPNHQDGSEWLFDGGLGYEVNLWTFNQKLVIAAAIAGCEWDEDRDGKID